MHCAVLPHQLLGHAPVRCIALATCTLRCPEWKWRLAGDLCRAVVITALCLALDN